MGKIVQVCQVTEFMYKNEAYHWAKNTKTFKPFVLVSKMGKSKLSKHYAIVKVIEESKVDGVNRFMSQYGEVLSPEIAFG